MNYICTYADKCNEECQHAVPHDFGKLSTCWMDCEYEPKSECVEVEEVIK